MKDCRDKSKPNGAARLHHAMQSVSLDVVLYSCDQ